MEAIAQYSARPAKTAASDAPRQRYPIKQLVVYQMQNPIRLSKERLDRALLREGSINNVTFCRRASPVDHSQCLLVATPALPSIEQDGI